MAEAKEMGYPQASPQAGPAPSLAEFLRAYCVHPTQPSAAFTITAIRCQRPSMGKGLMKATQQARAKALRSGPQESGGSVLSFKIISGFPSGPPLSRQPEPQMQSSKPAPLQP